MAGFSKLAAEEAGDRVLVRLPFGEGGELVVRDRRVKHEAVLLLQHWRTRGDRTEPVRVQQFALPRKTFIELLEKLLPALARWSVDMPRIGLEHLATRWRKDTEAKGDAFDRAVTHVLRALGAVEAARDADALTDLVRTAFEVRAKRWEGTPKAKSEDTGWGAGEAPIRRSGRRSIAARELYEDIEDWKKRIGSKSGTIDGFAVEMVGRVEYFCPTLAARRARGMSEGAEAKVVSEIEALEAKGNPIETVDADTLGRIVLVACGMSAQDASNFFKWATWTE